MGKFYAQVGPFDSLAEAERCAKMQVMDAVEGRLVEIVEIHETGINLWGRVGANVNHDTE